MYRIPETDARKIVKIEENVIDCSEIHIILSEISSDIETAKSVLQSHKNHNFDLKVDKKLSQRISSKIGTLKNDSIPARICKSSVPLHKDRYNGDGDLVENWVHLIYLKAKGCLILVDDFNGKKLKIDVKK